MLSNSGSCKLGSASYNEMKRKINCAIPAIYLTKTILLTHLGTGTCCTQIAEQIACLHVLHDQRNRLAVEANANEAHNVLVLEVAHQLRLLQQLGKLASAFAQALEGAEEEINTEVYDFSILGLTLMATRCGC